MLAVARAANAITIARGPLVADWEDESPQLARERFSALFYAAAALYEALKTSAQLEPHFSHLKAWRTGFGDLLGDEEVSRFRKQTLRRFRDKGTFHFDAGFFKSAASRWPAEDIVLATMASNRIGDIYVNAADDLLFDHILGPFSSKESMVAAFSAFADTTISVMNRFLNASHRLLPEALRELGVRRRRAV